MLAFTITFIVLVPLSIFWGGEHWGEYGKILGASVAFNLSVIMGILVRVLKKGLRRGQDPSPDRLDESLWVLLDRQKAAINKAQLLRAQNSPDQAMKTLNRVLKGNPNCSGALLIKAQILLEEYQNHAAASRYLKQVIKNTSEAIDLNEQAVALYKDLNPGGVFSGDFVHLVREKKSI